MKKYTNVGPYRVLGSRSVYRNKWLFVREDEVIHPNGSRGVFGVVRMKPGSTVLAVTDSREALLIREFKYGVERDTLELISGAIEESESPLDAAKRELREEAGFEAAEWVDLGVIDPFTTVIQSPNYLFLARDLTDVGRSPDDGETVEVIRLPFERLLKLVMANEITHAASCVSVMKAIEYFRNTGR